MLVVFRFVKGFKYRNEPECEENKDFIQYTKINFFERLKKSSPRTVLDKSWVKAPKLLEEVYCKVSKFSEAKILCCNVPKIQTKRPKLEVRYQNDANGIANSEDPDQTAPLGAV